MKTLSPVFMINFENNYMLIQENGSKVHKRIYYCWEKKACLDPREMTHTGRIEERTGQTVIESQSIVYLDNLCKVQSTEYISIYLRERERGREHTMRSGSA